jgi:hypothetical protein
MKRRGLQLGRRHRWTLYGVSLAVFVSGAAWAWADRLQEAGSLTWAGLKPGLLTVHGLSAVIFVLLLGSLLPGHVRRAWHARKNRLNGAWFLSAVTVLTVSGYALYYLGNEAWRNATAQLHLWLGFVAPGLLFWHIRSGRKATRQS